MNINRGKTQAYLSLGSNCANAGLKLREAVTALEEFPGVRICALSPVFQTEPQNYREQDWFFNQCVKLELEGDWKAEEFLRGLLKLELSLGRERVKAIRFGPRVIDLDLLVFGAARLSGPFCQLPHPRMRERAFVLLPLYIMEPCLLLHGKSLPFWLSRLKWKVEGNRIWQD